MRKLRILLTANPERPVPPRLYGEAERVIELLVTMYRRRGHEVGLAAHRESQTEVHALYPWPSVISQTRMDLLRNAISLRDAAKKFHPDVIHSFSRLLYLYPLLLGKRRPLIMSYQHEPKTANIARTKKLDWRGILSFTGCSEYLCGQGRPGGGDWTTIHNCADMDVYTFQPKVAGGAPLVFLSRIEQIQGTHLAIEAAKRAGVPLVIAGNHARKGENALYWYKMIEPLLGKDGVEYVGPVDDRQKNELLGKARALIVPIQWNEPSGNVFIEALARGTPVISSPRGALPEIVKDGEHGYLCEGVDALVEAIKSAGRIDRNACRQHAEENFSAGVIAERYLNHYVRCIEYASH